MQCLFRMCCFFEKDWCHLNCKAGRKQVMGRKCTPLCAGKHSYERASIPSVKWRARLASSHRMSIRGGFEWTKAVASSEMCFSDRGRWKGGGQVFSDRQTRKQAGRRRGKNRQRRNSRAVSLFIDSPVCMNDPFLQRGLKLCFVLSMTDGYDSFAACRRFRTNRLWKIKIS